jgi:hypothetical protein
VASILGSLPPQLLLDIEGEVRADRHLSAISHSIPCDRFFKSEMSCITRSPCMFCNGSHSSPLPPHTSFLPPPHLLIRGFMSESDGKKSITGLLDCLVPIDLTNSRIDLITESTKCNSDRVGHQSCAASRNQIRVLPQTLLHCFGHR